MKSFATASGALATWCNFVQHCGRLLRHTGRPARVTGLFELTPPLAPGIALLQRLGIESPVVVSREEADQHLPHLETSLLSAFRAAPETRAVLTGKASSIQRLYQALRRAGVAGKQVTNLAYWAPGRKGFSGVQR